MRFLWFQTTFLFTAEIVVGIDDCTAAMREVDRIAGDTCELYH